MAGAGLVSSGPQPAEASPAGNVTNPRRHRSPRLEPQSRHLAERGARDLADPAVQENRVARGQEERYRLEAGEDARNAITYKKV